MIIKEIEFKPIKRVRFSDEAISSEGHATVKVPTVKPHNSSISDKAKRYKVLYKKWGGEIKYYRHEHNLLLP